VDGHVPGHNEGWVTGTGSSAKRVGACLFPDLHVVTTVIAGRGTCRPTWLIPTAISLSWSPAV